MSACVNIKVVWNINETVPLLTFVLLNLKLALVIVPHVRLKQRCVGLWTRWLGKTLPHLWQASSKLNSKSTLWSSAMDSTPRSSDAEQQSAPNKKNILWKKKIFDAQKIFAAKQKYSQVLTDWAAAVWEDDAVGLCVVCLGGGGLELDPVWHGGQELLGQGQHPLVLLRLLLSRAASCSNTNTKWWNVHGIQIQSKSVLKVSIIFSPLFLEECRRVLATLLLSPSLSSSSLLTASTSMNGEPGLSARSKSVMKVDISKTFKNSWETETRYLYYEHIWSYSIFAIKVEKV